MTTVQSLGAESYVLLTTFRRDGRPVPTPVWVARDGEALAVWTVTASGKVKRIRRRSDVTVAPCDLRGNARGDAVAGRATVLDDAGTERVRSLMKKKYGVMGWLTIWGSLLRRGRSGTIGIRIVLTGGPAGS